MSATHRRLILSVLILVLSSTGITSADFSSGTNSIGLGLNVQESLYVRVDFSAGGVGQFQQGPGAVKPTTGLISVTAFYNGLVNRHVLKVFAYFSDPAKALVNGSGGAIPASSVQANITGLGSQVFNQHSPFSDASVELVSSDGVATNSAGELPASFNMELLGTDYAAGFYSGNLLLQAVAL